MKNNLKLRLNKIIIHELLTNCFYPGWESIAIQRWFTKVTSASFAVSKCQVLGKTKENSDSDLRSNILEVQNFTILISALIAC